MFSEVVAMKLKALKRMKRKIKRGIKDFGYGAVSADGVRKSFRAPAQKVFETLRECNLWKMFKNAWQGSLLRVLYDLLDERRSGTNRL